MQTLRPHEQAKADKARLAYAANPKIPHTVSKSNSVQYTGIKYQHKLTAVIYLEVVGYMNVLNPNPVMAWVKPEGKDKITTIPFSLLNKI
jgi:hypothetical protein